MKVLVSNSKDKIDIREITLFYIDRVERSYVKRIRYLVIIGKMYVVIEKVSRRRLENIEEKNKRVKMNIFWERYAKLLYNFLFTIDFWHV